MSGTRNTRIVGDWSSVLRSGYQDGGSITTSAGTTNTAGGTIPAYADTLHLYSTVAFRVAIGQATSGSLGMPLAPNVTHHVGVRGGGGTINVQTIGAAGTIHYGFTSGYLD